MDLEAEVARLRAELEPARAEAREAVARTHRQYRRDLVPLSPGAGARRRAPWASATAAPAAVAPTSGSTRR